MDTFTTGRESYSLINLLLNWRIEPNELNLKQVFSPQNQQCFSQLDSFSYLSDSWSLPFAFSCICLFLQTIHILLHWINTFRKPRVIIEFESSVTDPMTSTFSHSVRKKVKSYGGWTIFLFMVARLVGCLALFVLSMSSFLGCQRNHPGVVDTVSKHLIMGCPEGLMTLTFVNSFPSFSSVITPKATHNSSSTALQWQWYPLP
jgi:hypothetical protein